MNAFNTQFETFVTECQFKTKQNNKMVTVCSLKKLWLISAADVVCIVAHKLFNTSVVHLMILCIKRYKDCSGLLKQLIPLFLS